MLQDFDQQPLIGGSSLPHLAIQLLEKEYKHKHDTIIQSYLNSNHSTFCQGRVALFGPAGHLKLTSEC